MNCCNKCGKSKCGCCPPAEYGCLFDIKADPFNPDRWIVTLNGMSYPVTAPKARETATSLTANYNKAALIYKGEYDTYTVTGEQLGDLIKLGDLRDVDFDPTQPGNCFELIYHKWENCGDGCQNIADRWKEFNPFSPDALKDRLHYVRGANANGCPVYLDVPSDPSEYWFGGWRQDTGEFGYYQAEDRDTIPTNEDGDYLLLSQDPDTKKPIQVALPLNCILGNLVSGLGTSVVGDFTIVQVWQYLSSQFNSNTGAFSITWEDWYYNHTQHTGTGKVTGRMNWATSFDVNTGAITYKVTSVYWDKVKYKTYDGAPSTAEPIYLTLKGVNLATDAETTLVNQYQFDGNSDWTINLNTTITGYKEFVVEPGTSSGPHKYSWIFVDWEAGADDKGYGRVTFTNNLPGWDNCTF